jgi:hypothetical protein
MSRKAHPYLMHLNRLANPPVPGGARRSATEPIMRPEDQEGLLWAPFRQRDTVG